METQNPYLFIHIGLCIRALMHCVNLTREFIIKIAQDLVDDLNRVNFQVSSIGVRSSIIHW